MIRMICLIGALFANASHANELIFMSGSKLKTYCANVDTDSLDRGLCQGYLTGLMDTATTVQYLRRGNVNICVARDASPFQLRITFMQWAAKHPEDLPGAASALALEAFANAYPCK